jgi:hypothetical protein
MVPKITMGEVGNYDEQAARTPDFSILHQAKLKLV